MDHLPADQQAEKHGGRFAATHWSVVVAAGHASPGRRLEALDTLCRSYWEPLYTFIRGFGYDVHDAEDLTQGFFAHLLTAEALGGVSPAKGKFRSFLLAAVKNFLADERSKRTAAKRGGGMTLLTLDSGLMETRFQQECSAGRNADCLFDRRWALTLLQEAFLKLQAEFALAGKAEHFAHQSPFLSREGNVAEYDSVASRLHVKPGAVAVAVHRMRLRYRELIRAEVARTLAHPADIAEEMHYLLDLLCR